MTTSTLQDRDINALLGSRICHDLISPLGAIGNGVELLTMSGLDAAPEIALIAESIENANARIRFFRVAFGQAGASAQLGRSEIQSILTDLTKGTRTTIEWKIEGGLPRREVKLAFLLIQALESAMPVGGKITISKNANSWLIRGAADRLNIDPALWELLANPSADVEVSSANVHFALAHDTARRADRSVRSQISDSEIILSF